MADFIRRSNTPVSEVQEPTTTIQQEPVVTSKPTVSFVMVKNYRGGFGVTIEPYDFSTTARMIRFKHDQEKQHVPTKWALGVFVTPIALKNMQDGFFTFENLNELIKMAEDLGLYVPDSIKEPKVNLRDLKNALLKNDIPGAKKMLMNASQKLINDFIALARQSFDQLSVAMVTYIETTYKVSLRPIKLDE